MRLYHFINKKRGLDNLKKQRLKISQIEQLNDPFEFLGCNLSDQELRNTMTYMRKAMSQNTGLLCFSRNWQNPVQWAHYADRHKGLCLGFDVIDEFLTAVDYVKFRFPSLGNDQDPSFLIRSFFTKFSHWSYEEEYQQINFIMKSVIKNSRNGKLKESWSSYKKWGKGPKRELRFSKSRDPNIEESYATHFIKRQASTSKTKAEE